MTFILRPETCQCEIECIYDDIIKEFSFVSIIKTCSFHSNLTSNGPLLLNNILTELRLKNAVYNTLIQELPEPYVIIDPETGRKRINTTQVQITFSFAPIAKTATNGGIRKMTLFYKMLQTKLTNPQQNQLNSIINQKLAEHKWIIDRDLVEFVNLG